MSTNEEIVGKYRHLWTTDLGRYALLQTDPSRPDLYAHVIDLETDVWIVIEEDEDVTSILVESMRRAGIVTLSAEDISARRKDSARIVERYRDMWTTDLHRYAIVQNDPSRPNDCGILDLESGGWVVIEEDEEVTSLLFDNMRRAGVRTLSSEDVRSK